MTNPSSKVRLFVQVHRPQKWKGEILPTLVLVPGGLEGHTTDIRGRGGYGGYGPFKPQGAADAGFTVVGFDPDGRGKSEGKEDIAGYIHQDGLAAVIYAAATLPGVDLSKIGVVSFSIGTTAATGALVRHADLPIRFLIDWEGPAGDRFFFGCGNPPGSPQRSGWVRDCQDNAFWVEREVLTFLPKIRVPYQRIQSQIDHGTGQRGVEHAVNMVNTATKNRVPWTRLNDLAPNQSFDLLKPPAMLPGLWSEQPLTELVVRHARDLLALH